MMPNWSLVVVWAVAPLVQDNPHCGQKFRFFSKPLLVVKSFEFGVI